MGSITYCIFCLVLIIKIVIAGCSLYFDREEKAL